MVKTSTLAIMLQVFFITMIVSEKYFVKKNVQHTILKVMVAFFIIIFTLLTIVVLLPSWFPLLIHGSVALCTIVSVYMRYYLQMKNLEHTKKG